MRNRKLRSFLSLFLLAAGGMLMASAGMGRKMPGPGMWKEAEDFHAGAVDGAEPCESQEEQDMELLEEYQKLCPDVKAVIRIPGTVLCHPVVQTPEEEEHYLYRDLRGAYNSHGVPFLSAGSDLEREGGNAVIYGHNIYKRTRDVFCDLAGYEKVEYYKEHPCIETISESGVRRWLIFAYYLVDNADEDPFRYSETTEFSGPEDLEAYLEEIQMRNWLLVDTGVKYGDTLLTLSSCSVELAGSGTNRMVVVGKLLKKDEACTEIVRRASQAEHPLLPARLQ